MNFDERSQQVAGQSAMIMLGLPDLSDWTNNGLPAILGPAIIVGGYWLIAALGKRRVERQIFD